MLNASDHIDARTVHPTSQVGSGSCEDIAYGEVARGKTGWVILKEQPPGTWITVSGPVASRETVRRLRIKALSTLMSHSSEGGANPVKPAMPDKVFVGRKSRLIWDAMADLRREGWGVCYWSMQGRINKLFGPVKVSPRHYRRIKRRFCEANALPHNGIPVNLRRVNRR
jgi:hypothetical protein